MGEAPTQHRHVLRLRRCLPEEVREMRRRASVALISSVAFALLAPRGAGAHAERGRTPACLVDWGSLPESAPAPPSPPLLDVRAGRHPCFDRVVLDIGGQPPPGYDVRYTTDLATLGSGAHLPVAGGAVLTATVTSPGRDGRLEPTVPWRAGTEILTSDELAAREFRTLRHVVYGGSFEGRSVVGIGVRARLPFRVFQLPGPGSGSRLVVDVVHRW